jgi:hypothetical protein
MRWKDWTTMKPFALLIAALLTATTLYAQVYEWKDGNGKTIYSDQAPVGNVRDLRRIDSGSSAAGSPAQKSSADREMEFRKRQKEAQENTEKAGKEQTASATKAENCVNARRQLQALESGERIALRDDKGERYYMDDAQRAQEIAKLRQTVQSYCN